MGTFDTTGRDDAAKTCSENTLKKLDRLNTALRGQAYDAKLFDELAGRSLDELWAIYVGL